VEVFSRGISENQAVSFSLSAQRGELRDSRVSKEKDSTNFDCLGAQVLCLD